MMHYILPALPALALMTGPALARLMARGWRSEAPAGAGISLGALAVLTMTAGAAVVLVPALNPDITYEHAGVVLLAGPALAAAAGLSIFVVRRKAWAAMAAPVAVFVVMVACAAVVAPRLDDFRSVEKLTKLAANALEPGDRLVTYGDYYHGAPFYSGRRVAVVRNWGELDFGRARDTEAGKWFKQDDDAFLQMLLDPGRKVMAIGETNHYKRFKKWVDGTPGILLFEWARVGDKSLFSNRPCE